MRESRCRVQTLSNLILGALLGMTLVQASSTSARAGYIVNSLSSETVSFALWNTNSGSFGSPIWSSDPRTPNMLLSAGPLAAGSPAGTFPTAPYPGLASVKTQGNTFTLPSGTGAFSNSNSADPSILDRLTYGSSTVKAAVSNNLANKGSGLNSVVGVSFNSGTFLNSGVDMAPATAAVTYAYLHGDFTYTGATVSARVGSILSASGYASPNGFVEMANVGTITIGTKSFNFSMIVAGLLDNSGNFMQLSSGPISTNYLGDGYFTVAGSYTAPSVVSITSGTRITIDSYLTMIADPASYIELTRDGIPLSQVPDIVAAFGGPVGGIVPEPAAVVQLGTGLLLTVGLLGWRRRKSVRRLILACGRNSARSPALLILGLSFASSGQASAASVTIDDLITVPAVQVAAFNAYSSIVGLDHTVEFDGKYLSSGGYPAPGTSVFYTVVFTENNGTTYTDLTRITIAGLSNPTATRNTQVLVHYEGIVTSPIPPDHVYFVPEPVGYFDVAAYLFRKNLPGVPQDLSVRINSLGAVPEPASLITSGIGLLMAGLWRVNRRSRPS